MLRTVSELVSSASGSTSNGKSIEADQVTQNFIENCITVSTSVPQFSIHAGSATASSLMSIYIILSESRWMSL